MRAVRVSVGESLAYSPIAVHYVDLVYMLSIKREIGHLCHDEQKPTKGPEKQSSSSNVNSARATPSADVPRSTPRM